MTERIISNIKLPNGEVCKISGLDGKLTNCLLEVPQRIKLELNDGVLTLKAGSQVIVPNGFEEDGVTPRFDYVDIESDLTLTRTWGTAEPVFVFLNSDDMNDMNIAIGGVNRFSSGTTAPTLTNAQWWYDTTANLIKRYSNTSDSGDRVSLPIAICTKPESVENSVISSINQVFNGMGYIGSTVWVDKGVKGLIPNGRNEDGTLRNIEFTTDKVIKIEVELGTSQNVRIFYNYNSSIIGFSGNEEFKFDKEKNMWVYSPTGVYFPMILLGTSTSTSNAISNFNPKQPFRAVDYSDKAEVADWSFPSNKYINLTLGASGTTYTAPANGWFVVRVTGTLVDLSNDTTQFQAVQTTPANTIMSKTLPCKRGDVYTLRYTGTVNWFKFIYAQGEV